MKNFLLRKVKNMDTFVFISCVETELVVVNGVEQHNDVKSIRCRSENKILLWLSDVPSYLLLRTMSVLHPQLFFCLPTTDVFWHTIPQFIPPFPLSQSKPFVFRPYINWQPFLCPSSKDRLRPRVTPAAVRSSCLQKL